MQRNQGFTLIELLIVISIIALLVTILLPALGEVREKSRQATCAANLRGIGSGLQAYASDFGTMPTMGRAERYDRKPEPERSLVEFWEDRDTYECNLQHWWLATHAGHFSEKALHCPSDTTYRKIERKREGSKRDIEERAIGFVDKYNSSFGLQLAIRNQRWNPAYLGAPGQKSDTIIAADKPLFEDDGDVDDDNWNANHYDRGCNGLMASGSVSWHTDKTNRVGYLTNNIYLGDLRRADPPDIDKRLDNNMWTGNPSDSFLYWGPWETEDKRRQ